MNTIKFFSFIFISIACLAACNNSKPKAVSNDIAKTIVVVNRKKDSVINNPEKNYGNATVSEPCVKCLLSIIQKTHNYKKLTSAIPPHDIIYDVNWITSTKPVAIGNDSKIVNGMAIDITLKGGGLPKKLITYLYDNENAQFYIRNAQNQYSPDSKVDSASLKNIRNSCFWGVASSR
ncbi:MAG TPA: hypothetical protein VIJ27_08000 [Mucilaginibacter sp.]